MPRTPFRARPVAAGRPSTQRSGFTLLELMIVLCLVSLLCAMAVPGLGQMVARHRLEAAARHLQADLALARLEVLRTGRSAHVAFRTGKHWCWSLSLDAPVDCSVPGGSSLVFKRVAAAEHPDVLLLRAEPMALDGPHGLPQQALPEAVFALPSGQHIALRMGPMGRGQVCAAAGPVNALPACRPRTAQP